MLAEQYFPELSRYPKTGGVSEDAIQAFKHQKGYIDLDDPEQKRKYVSRDKATFNNVLDDERKAGAKQAKIEHQQALQNLKSGKAQHRITDESAPNPPSKPAPKKKKRYTVSPEKKAQYAEAQRVKRKTASEKRKAEKLAKKQAEAANKPPSRSELSDARKADILSALKIHGRVMVTDQSSGNKPLDYQKQLISVKALRKSEGLDIVRVKRLKTGLSYYMIGDFIESDMPKITGRLDRPDRHILETALASGKLVKLDKMQTTARQAIGVMRQFALKKGVDVYAVFSGSSVAGWIVLAAGEAGAAYNAWRKRICDLADAMDGLEHLKKQQRLPENRLPVDVPDVILDAVDREYRRVNGQ